MVPTTYYITLFERKKDNVADEEYEAPWENLVEVFSEHQRVPNWVDETGVEQEGKDGRSFVFAQYKSIEEGATPVLNKRTGQLCPRRYGDNVKFVSGLVLDYDGGTTIDEVREELNGLKQLGYTSFNHLRNGKTHKFRVVLPFETPCPAEEWRKRKLAWKEMFPVADPKSFTLGQIFFTPRYDGTTPKQVWHADGELFRWEDVPCDAIPEHRVEYTNREYSDSFRDAVLQKVAEHDWSSYEEWQSLCSMMVGAGYSESDFLSVCWSDRASQEASRTLWKSFSSGTSQVTMGSLIYRLKELFPGWSPPADPTREEPKLVLVKGEKKPPEPREVVELPKERQFSKCSSSEARKKNVRHFVNRFLRSFSAHGVLRTPEGYGKSTEIVAELIRSGHDVLFCCLSHKQVAEKMSGFELYSPERVWSTSALIEDRLGVKAVMKEKDELAWGDPGTDIESTCEVIMKELKCTKEEAEASIGELREEAVASRQSKAKLLITTFATGDVLFKMKNGRLNRVIVVDDPSMSDLILFKCGFEKKKEEDDESSQQVVLAERKPEEVIFGKEYSFQSKVIWTTTEKLIVDYLKKHHNECLVEDIVENLDTEANILMVPTELVRKVTKKVLKPMCCAIEDDSKEDLLFLANGVKSEFNLVNTKGRNDLAKNTVIAISFPHPSDVASVVLSLGYELNSPEAHEVQKQMVADILDQAVGRGQGYRYCGTKVLILVEPHLELAIRERSRYRLNSLEGLSRRGRFHGVPLTWHVEFPTWWAYWQAYLAAWSNHVVVWNGKIIETFTLTQIGTTDEQKLIMKRLKKPTEFGELAWKALDEVVEGEERRNFAVKFNELIEKFNESKQPAKAKEMGKKNAGKVWCHDPVTQTSKRVARGKIPKGWSPGRA